MYPDESHYHIHEHGSVCIDPAYHEQYHVRHTKEECVCTDDCPCKSTDVTGTDNTDSTETLYNGLPRYDHPHPHPHAKCSYHKYERSLLRDEEVGNIIRVESRIIESLLVKLYSCIADRDVIVKMELGTKYTIKWIGVDGVNSCTGTLVDFKASQHSTIYQPVNADGYYIVMDCSEQGKSDIKKILISTIRDILEVSLIPDDSITDTDDNVDNNKEDNNSSVDTNTGDADSSDNNTDSTDESGNEEKETSEEDGEN
jgi:hypothetical protein